MKFVRNVFCCLSIMIFAFETGCCAERTACVGDNDETLHTAKLFDAPIKEHPRILFSTDREAEIKQLAKTDPFLRDLIAYLVSEADDLLKADMLTYPAGASTILATSREHIYRLVTLSLAYRLTGEKKYAAKAEKNLLNACQYPDWGPQHYLDVAEMATAVAIGYDWLYGYLPSEVRRVVQRALKNRALLPAIAEYESATPNWSKRETNWNVVCNTGMVIAALAIAEDEPAMAEKIITEAVADVPICMQYFAPDGVCYEGPGYWYYTTVNLAMLIGCLTDNNISDGGLSDMSGINQTASCYVASVSPAGRIFNFADTYRSRPNYGPCYFFYSRKYDLPNVSRFYHSLISTVLRHPQLNPRWHFFLNIPWYDPRTEVPVSDMPRMQVFNNELNPIMVFHGKPGTTESIYMIAKGGAGNMPHQHLDTGSFVVEADNVRWLEDLGTIPDDYSLDGFWDYTPYTGQRWTYFRYNNFSHNTLSIDNTLQNSAGRGTILRFDTDSDRPFGIIDMTSVYSGLAEKVHRQFKLLSANTVLVEDDVTLVPGTHDIEWRAITKADAKIEGNAVTLTQDGKSFYIKIVSPVGSVFTCDTATVSGDSPGQTFKINILKTFAKHVDKPEQTVRVIMGRDRSETNDTAWFD